MAKTPATESEAARVERISSKIAASQERLRVRASAATEKASANLKKARETGERQVEKAVQDHPFTLVAGGLVVGALIGALLPKNGRVSKSSAQAARGLGSGATELLAAAAQFGVMYGGKLLEVAAEAGQSGKENVGKLGSSIADRTAAPRQRASEIASAASSAARDRARDVVSNARSKLNEVASRAKKD